MLKEFINGQRDSFFPRNLNEYFEKTVRVFDSLVDFLRDPNTFPHPEINQLVTLMWRLIGNKEIPVVLDQWGIPTMSFVVIGNDIKQMPMFIIPQNFISQVAQNPVLQLGAIVNMASQARDFYVGKIKKGSSNEVNRRAKAWEAEALITLKQMAQQENFDLVFNKYQLQILAENPQGLRSLPPELNYSTPVWQPPRFG